MTGPVTRKIELAKQIEEQKLTVDEPARAATSKLADERLERRRAILKTLHFNLEHEHLFRAFMAERKGGEGGLRLRLRLRGGQLCWASALFPDDFTPFTDSDLSNIVLARFDPPAEV